MNLLEIINLLRDHPSIGVGIFIVLMKCVDISPVKINPLSYAMTHIGNFSKFSFRKFGNMMNEDLIAQVNILNANINELEERFEQRLDDIENESDQRRIKDCRWAILDFANSLPKRIRTVDEFEHVFDIHGEYEELLKKYDLENGRTTRAMHKIAKYYQKSIDNGDF